MIWEGHGDSRRQRESESVYISVLSRFGTRKSKYTQTCDNKCFSIFYTCLLRSYTFMRLISCLVFKVHSLLPRRLHSTVFPASFRSLPCVVLLVITQFWCCDIDSGLCCGLHICLTKRSLVRSQAETQILRVASGSENLQKQIRGATCCDALAIKGAAKSSKYNADPG